MSSREYALEREVARLEHARDLCVEELGHANERANRLLDRVTAAEKERDVARAEVEALRDALRDLLVFHPDTDTLERYAASDYRTAVETCRALTPGETP